MEGGSGCVEAAWGLLGLLGGMFFPGQGPRELSPPSRNSDSSLTGTVRAKAPVVTDGVEGGSGCVEAAGGWRCSFSNWHLTVAEQTKPLGVPSLGLASLVRNSYSRG